ncbi:MAG: hypothetical protein ABIJ09_02205 [Pseudomonadota bacterium]
MPRSFNLTTAALLLSTLTASSTGCMTRVDVRQVLRELPADAAQQRFAQLAADPACQKKLQQDDAECWEKSSDVDVMVETGVSRTLHGYLTSPYTVQTHLKVRLETGDPERPEVYYFADGGDGGLEAREGYGRADGHINVFCSTSLDDLFDPSIDSNHRVQQAQVDTAALCVHQALLDGQSFGTRVKSCLHSVRSPEAQLALRNTPPVNRAAPLAGTALISDATGVR